MTPTSSIGYLQDCKYTQPAIDLFGILKATSRKSSPFSGTRYQYVAFMAMKLLFTFATTGQNRRSATTILVWLTQYAMHGLSGCIAWKSFNRLINGAAKHATPFRNWRQNTRFIIMNTLRNKLPVKTRNEIPTKHMPRHCPIQIKTRNSWRDWCPFHLSLHSI